MFLKYGHSKKVVLHLSHFNIFENCRSNFCFRNLTTVYHICTLRKIVILENAIYQNCTRVQQHGKCVTTHKTYVNTLEKIAIR